MNIIDEAHYAIRVGKDWEGTAVELQRELTQSNSGMAHEARQLLSWSNACGTFLRRLAKQYSDRLTSKGSNGTTYWKITPPEREPGATSEEEVG